MNLDDPATQPPRTVCVSVLLNGHLPQGDSSQTLDVYAWGTHSPRAMFEFSASPGLVYIGDGGLDLVPLSWPIEKCGIVWVGDGDSLSADAKIRLDMLAKKPDEIEAPGLRQVWLPVDKSESDFGAILDLIAADLTTSSSSSSCESQAAALTSLRVDIYAALGGRRDHEHINILECLRFVENHKAPCVCVMHPAVVITNAAIEIGVKPGRVFSVVVLNSVSAQHEGRVFIDGARFQGEFTLQRPSHGLSNEATGETLVIAPLPHAGGRLPEPIILYF